MNNGGYIRFIVRSLIKLSGTPTWNINSEAPVARNEGLVLCPECQLHYTWFQTGKREYFFSDGYLCEPGLIRISWDGWQL